MSFSWNNLLAFRALNLSHFPPTHSLLLLGLSRRKQALLVFSFLFLHSNPGFHPQTIPGPPQFSLVQPPASLTEAPKGNSFKAEFWILPLNQFLPQAPPSQGMSSLLLSCTGQKLHFHPWFFPSSVANPISASVLVVLKNIFQAVSPPPTSIATVHPNERVPWGKLKIVKRWVHYRPAEELPFGAWKL